jgi:uncharacterized membrane protein
MKSKWSRKLISYVLNGLIISLPVFGTGYIVVKIFVWLDGLLPSIFVSDPSTLEKLGHRGIGIIMLISLLFLMGWLGSLFINDRMKGLFESMIERIPGVNNLYSSISDLLNAFVGNKKKFNRPVLVKVSKDMDLEMIGFVTDEDLKELGQIDGKVAVYFPMSYSFSGHLMIVPKANVKVIERNAVEVMKYTVSGGVVEFDDDKSRRE